jgi:hypothetical protein
MLNDIPLKQVPHESFLEIQIDETLKWYDHTCKVANNISKKIDDKNKELCLPEHPEDCLQLLHSAPILPTASNCGVAPSIKA